MKNGTTTTVLLERFFKYFNHNNCRKLSDYNYNAAYMDFKKLCAITKNGNINLDS